MLTSSSLASLADGDVGQAGMRELLGVCSRTRTSSARYSEKLRSLNQFDFQSWM